MQLRNVMRRSTARAGAALIAALSLVGCAELAYQHMNDPKRDVSKVADIGAGGGYFTWYLAGAAGPRGTVYAVEIDDTALSIIEKEMAARGITNVVPIHAEPQDAKLPEPVDLIFSCDTYHHMGQRVVYFGSLASSLKPNGRIAILDFHPHGFFSGLLGHGTAKDEVRREMEAAGYRLIDDVDLLESQHFQIFSRQVS
jgi:arsenite methyltransferase